MQLTKTRFWILDTVRNRSGVSLTCMKKILCFSVEPDQRKALSRHGSVEIFDGAYNLTVPNKLSRHASTSKLEEIHSDHIKIVGEMEDAEQSVGVKETDNKVMTGLTVTEDSSNHQEVASVNSESSRLTSSSSSSQRSEIHQSVTSCEQTSYQEMRQTNIQEVRPETVCRFTYQLLSRRAPCPRPRGTRLS